MGLSPHTICFFRYFFFNFFNFFYDILGRKMENTPSTLIFQYLCSPFCFVLFFFSKEQKRKGTMYCLVHQSLLDTTFQSFLFVFFNRITFFCCNNLNLWLGDLGVTPEKIIQCVIYCRRLVLISPHISELLIPFYFRLIWCHKFLFHNA